MNWEMLAAVGQLAAVFVGIPSLIYLKKVAAFFAENASLTVNGGPPTPVLEVARGFMRDFPDMTVTVDKVEPRADRTAFYWTLTGTYAGTGNHVRISGYELWKINNAGLIAESSGHFDAAEYERQLRVHEL